MVTEDFFQNQKINSKIKTEIVTEYFSIWSGILGRVHAAELCYIDLFCGPGTYDDGTESTPLLILRHVVENKTQELCDRLITVFNDENNSFITGLQRAASQLPKISRLKHTPQFSNHAVDVALAEYFEKQSIPPSLIFLDPCGYRGLTARLVKALTQNFGCDAIMFFNTSGIYRNITNPQENENINDIFGKEIAEGLRAEFPKIRSVHQKEKLLVESFIKTVKAAGVPYVIPFCFKRVDKKATSHHLIFLSRHPLAFEKMKEVMAKKSSDFSPETVPSYCYSDLEKHSTQASLLPSGDHHNTIQQLKDRLLQAFRGKTATTENIIKHHNSVVQNSIENPYTIKNHKDALCQLEGEKKISVALAPGKIRRGRKGTFADDLIVTFTG